MLIVTLRPAAKAGFSMDAGATIQSVADYVRLLACFEHPFTGEGASTVPGAWIVDVDSIFIRRFGFAPSRSGHVFGLASHKENTTTKVTALSFKLHYARTSGELADLVFPMYLPQGSAVVRDLLLAVEGKSRITGFVCLLAGFVSSGCVQLSLPCSSRVGVCVGALTGMVPCLCLCMFVVCRCCCMALTRTRLYVRVRPRALLTGIENHHSQRYTCIHTASHEGVLAIVYA